MKHFCLIFLQYLQGSISVCPKNGIAACCLGFVGDTPILIDNNNNSYIALYPVKMKMKKWRQQQAFLLVPCFAAPPPTPTPPPSLHQPIPRVTISDSGEGIAEEVRFEAGFKRCERCRKSGLYRDRVPHTRRLILERPCTSAFQVNTWDTEQFARR